MTTKRILKRHKRQVARAKKRVRTSEPDVRTPEQIKAARELSRSAADRRNDPWPRYRAQSSSEPVERPQDTPDDDSA